MPDKHTSDLLRMAAAGVAVGLAITALRFDLPLRSLFWDEGWWGWFASQAGFSWKQWVTNATVDQTITLLGRLLGLVLLVGGALMLGQRQLRYAAWSVFFILLLQHFLLWKEHFWHLGHLLELGLQTGAPLLFLGYSQFQGRAVLPSAGGAPPATAITPYRFWWAVRLLIAVTFVGHGLYAAGIHPVPANFIFMTQSGLGVGETQARQFLLVVGLLDFVAAFLLLLPLRKAQLAALGWIIPWAILTTLARLWSYGGLVSATTLCWQWIPEAVRRLPHVLIPLALWRALRAAQSLKLGSRT